MAELIKQGDELVVKLSTFEKAEAAHGDVRVPLSSVRGVEVVDDAVNAVPAWKVIGAGWPGSFAIGTFSGGPDQVKAFAVVHRDHPRGVKVQLEGAKYDLIVISSDDPEAAISKLGDLD